MGLLDEAIRDHLELKRKRGADPTQLAREEDEALGPAVRSAVDTGAQGEAASAASEPAVGAEQVEAGEELPAEPPAEAPPPEPPPPAPEPLADAGPAVAPDDAHPAQEPAEPVEPERPAGQETAPFDPEDLFADEDAQVEEPGPQPGEGEGEDVLEETPEFLQETPEHDRLWFEQKPPRDFDFDG